MALWDMAMAPVRAVGGAFNELDKAMQGRNAGQEKQRLQLLNDLQVVQQTTPENTPARIEQMRSVMAKHGLSMPPMMSAQGENQYEQIPTPYERGMGQYAEARTTAAQQKGLDPLAKAKAVSELIGSRPWSSDEQYDPANPEHRIWMQSLESLGGAEPSPKPGSALRSIPTPAQAPDQGTPTGAASPWGEQMMPSPRQEELVAVTPRKPTARVGAFRGIGGPGGGGISPQAGAALSAIPAPQVEAALGQYEAAGGVTTRNASQVAASKAAPTGALTSAAKGIKAYQASPEYAQTVLATGRQLKDTDLSGQMKSLLAAESSPDQKRLLQLVHKYGEAAVLDAMQGSQKPKDGF